MTRELANFDRQQEQGDIEVRQADAGMIEVASTRAAQQVQASMVVAKRFPRNAIASEGRILTACQRTKLAEVAFYSYSKGGTQICKPSVHLARMMAAQWGNCESGWTVLSQSATESFVEAFCIDYETNHKQSITFVVRHEMKAHNQIKKLTDPRDIYEHCANMAARRVRACILAVLPNDIQDAAVKACQKTLAGKSDVPLIDRVKKMVRSFEQFGVTADMITERLGHKLEAINEVEFVKLRGIYTSLNDEASSREDWFNVSPNGPATVDDLTPGKKKAAKKKASTKKDDEPEPEQSGEPETAEEFFGRDLAANKKASKEEIEELLRTTDLVLASAKAERDPMNRTKVRTFACIGQEFPDLNSMTSAQAKEATELVQNLTDADVNEALNA